MRCIIVIFVFFVQYTCVAQTDSLNLLYRIAYFDLTENHKSTLDSFFTKLPPYHDYNILITGSADYLGSHSSNQLLSDKRVRHILDYLHQEKFDMLDTIRVKSYGEIDNKGYRDPGGGVEKHRTVTIKITNRIPEGNVHKLLELEPGKKLILNNLNFYGARHFLIKRSIPELKRLLRIMRENPTLKIEIHGHVCCLDYHKHDDGFDRDTRTFNLSVNRAEHIYDYLVHNGIDPSRMTHKGRGGKYRLIDPELTEEDRVTNRRVEIILVEK